MTDHDDIDPLTYPQAWSAQLWLDLVVKAGALPSAWDRVSSHLRHALLDEWLLSPTTPDQELLGALGLRITPEDKIAVVSDRPYQTWVWGELWPWAVRYLQGRFGAAYRHLVVDLQSEPVSPTLEVVRFHLRDDPEQTLEMFMELNNAGMLWTVYDIRSTLAEP